MLKVLNYNVYGLDRAMTASGLPMSVDPSKLTESEKRMKSLGNAKSGSGHDCALKGIVVEARVRYPLYWTKQFQRYHFADIVSSQSTMHRVTKFDIAEQCNEYVDKRIIEVIQEKVELYNWMVKNDRNAFSKHGEIKTKYQLFLEIISSLPSGFEMEMEIVTNYLQLKTIYEQRKNHKLPDWHVFCEWIESLPNFKEFCLGGNE